MANGDGASLLENERPQARPTPFHQDNTQIR